MSMNQETRNRLAARLAQDIPEGAYVNLGVGLPTLVANHIPSSREVFLHSENGVLGRWIRPREGLEDPDMINAGKEAIELLPGAAIFDHAISFGMMRGGHLDICVMGAYQVAVNGDLANWHTDEPSAVPAVGGAMDLAAGAKKVFVIMEHLGKGGAKKILSQCTYPLTGLRCVSRIYTDMAIIDVRPEGFRVVELADGVTREVVQNASGASLTFDPSVR
jgi:3-oxoadipate CoA-transferase, beta subunit